MKIWLILVFDPPLLSQRVPLSRLQVPALNETHRLSRIIFHFLHVGKRSLTSGRGSWVVGTSRGRAWVWVQVVSAIVNNKWLVVHI